MEPLRVGSLFAGIGGCDLGLERAGMVSAFQCEISKPSRQVLNRHWPEVRKFNDVQEINKRNAPNIDVLVGGFPCQDLSLAGKRTGLAGERSGLWWEFHRLIGELRPRYVIGENVTGLISSWSPVKPPPYTLETRSFDTEEEAKRYASGIHYQWDMEETNDLETILHSLAELGYWWSYRIFDSKYFGVAQERRRVFIVASLNPQGFEKILFESNCYPGNSSPKQEAEAPTTEIPKPDARKNNESKPIVFNWQASPNFGLHLSDEYSYSLQVCNKPAVFKVPTTHLGLAEQEYIRRLTPVEYERLQAFPDGWTEWGITDDGQRKEMTDEIRYAQLGNAVTVNILDWIGQQIVHSTK